MGFLSGRVTFVRYRVKGRQPGMFGPEHLAQLSKHAIGKHRALSGDGVEVGWTAGDHVLDTRFDLAKNIINDALQFAMRVDTTKIPADLLRAYTQVELEGITTSDKQPSMRQRREARTNARERLETEAADGRFLRRKTYPILWDGLSNELLVGSTAVTVTDRLIALFQQTFDRSFESLGAGEQAFRLAEARRQTRGIDDARSSEFVPGVTPADVAWLPDEANRDFLGNEFLLWLWYVLDAESDTITLADDSEAAAMLARTLVLECPRGETGRETISSDGPGRLPEARRAIRAGKLPRKAGFTLVRHDHEFECTLHAESLAVSSAKLPKPEAEEPRARLEERLGLLRELIETLDLIYDHFGKIRTGGDWPQELAKIQKWIQADDRPRRAR